MLHFAISSQTPLPWCHSIKRDKPWDETDLIYGRLTMSHYIVILSN